MEELDLDMLGMRKGWGMDTEVLCCYVASRQDNIRWYVRLALALLLSIVKASASHGNYSGTLQTPVRY